MDDGMSEEQILVAISLVVRLLYLTDHLIAQVGGASLTLTRNADEEVLHDKVGLGIKEVVTQFLFEEHLEWLPHDIEELCATHFPILLGCRLVKQ